jgi:hypothetical protein
MTPGAVPVKPHILVCFLAFCISMTLRQRLKAHALGLAAAIGLEPGDDVRWELLDRGELHLVRIKTAPVAAKSESRRSYRFQHNDMIFSSWAKLTRFEPNGPLTLKPLAVSEVELDLAAAF